jgi:hypothetical protein
VIMEGPAREAAGGTRPALRHDHPLSAMITEDFWVYVSGMFRDHGRPGTGRRPEALDPPSAMITRSPP